MTFSHDAVANFDAVENVGALDRLFQTSHERPVVLFKHSVTCSVSADAYEDMANYAGPIELVVVQSARAVADEIEARTGIRHESPQVIILRNGKPVWNASHWKVRAEAVAGAVEEHK
jgi:bacillithiol system protein YtxJ